MLLNMGTLINWIMANINYRAGAFQKCQSRCTICPKLIQVYYTLEFFLLIQSILGGPGRIFTISNVQGRFNGRTKTTRRRYRGIKHPDRLLFGTDFCSSLSAAPLHAPDEIALRLVFQMCQCWSGNRLHTCLFCVCLSLIICGEYRMCSLRGLNSGLVFGAIWQTQTGKGLETKILTVHFFGGQESSLPS